MKGNVFGGGNPRPRTRLDAFFEGIDRQVEAARTRALIESNKRLAESNEQLANAIKADSLPVTERPVDLWLSRDKNVFRLIERLKELHFVKPNEAGYDVLLQPGTFAQALYDAGFRDWSEIPQYFHVQGKARTAGSLRSAAAKPDSREYRKLKTQLFS